MRAEKIAIQEKKLQDLTNLILCYSHIKGTPKLIFAL